MRDGGGGGGKRERERNVEKRKFGLVVKCRQPPGIKKATRQLPGRAEPQVCRKGQVVGEGRTGRGSAGEH